MPKPVAPVRLPLDCDPFDPDAVRDWLCGYLEEAIPLEGQPKPAIHLFFDGHREVLELSPLAREAGFDLAATWTALATRPDVHQALLVARFEVGDNRTAAVVMAAEREGSEVTSWWACIRGYAMTPEGIGTLTEPWQGVRGEGAPPEPFASFTRPATGAVAWPVLPGRPPHPDMRAMFGELPPAARIPATAMEMAELVQASTMPTVEKEGLDHARLIRLRGRAFELWEIRGEHLPSSMDDLIRYICQRGEPAEAVGIAVGTVFEENGLRLHAVDIKAELGGRRAQRLVTLHKPPGAVREVPSKTHWRELGEVREGAGWLGVDPMVNWELGPLGAVEQ